MNENLSTETRPPSPNSRLASASRRLGRWGIIPAPLVIPILLITGSSRADEAGAYLALACILISTVTGLAATLCGLVARFTKASTRPAATDGIIWGLACLLSVGLNLVAWPNVVRVHPHSYRNACINNLRQIDGAKEQWAFENKKTQTDAPTWDDLVGTDKYIKVQPMCPQNGTFTIGNMATKPRCSNTDHTLP
jgi:hypothetical protein